MKWCVWHFSAQLSTQIWRDAFRTSLQAKRSICTDLRLVTRASKRSIFWVKHFGQKWGTLADAFLLPKAAWWCSDSLASRLRHALGRLGWRCCSFPLIWLQGLGPATQPPVLQPGHSEKHIKRPFGTTVVVVFFWRSSVKHLLRTDQNYVPIQVAWVKTRWCITSWWGNHYIYEARSVYWILVCIETMNSCHEIDTTSHTMSTLKLV